MSWLHSLRLVYLALVLAAVGVAARCAQAPAVGIATRQASAARSKVQAQRPAAAFGKGFKAGVPRRRGWSRP